NYFRDYDPAIGRYIESDPIGLKGGLNTYSYVGSDPLTGKDPTGEANSGSYFRPNWGKDLCSYYDDLCKKWGNCAQNRDEYACNAGKCCRSFSEKWPNRCT